MRKVVVLACLVAMVLPLVAVAQEMGPPNVLVMYREDVKAGKTIAHQKSEAAWAQATARAKWPVHYLGMTSVIGPTQALFGYGYPSLEAYEKDEAAQDKSAAMKAVNDQFNPSDGEYISEVRTTVARLVPELTSNPMPIGDIRVFRVRTFRVRIGHDAEFLELIKLANADFNKAGKGGSSVTFHVVGGGPAGTYMSFYGAKSMSAFDQQINLQEIMGSDFEHFISLVDKSITTFTDDFFQVDPKMSYADAAWVKADPNFWAPKAMTAKAASGDGKSAAAAPKKKDTAKGQ